MMTAKSAFDLESHRLEHWQAVYRLACDQSAGASERDRLTRMFDEFFPLERYWAYPGRETLYQLKAYLDEENLESFCLLCGNLLDRLKSKDYRAQEFVPFYTNLSSLDKPQSSLLASHYTAGEKNRKLKPYFEVLIIHPDPGEYEALYRNALANFKTFHDDFLYDILFVDNYSDAIIAVLSNPEIQACIYLDGFKVHEQAQNRFDLIFAPFFQGVSASESEPTIALKKHIASLRPAIDHYYMSEGFASELHQESFNRILYAQSNSLFADMHALILSGIEQRYSTPFFDALRSYARRPKSAFHALPISQGQSIQPSWWLKDVAEFYGEGIFSAETSSTLGGMDSIMEPRGSISQAQNRAAQLFGSRKTFFVTNGTTTANKIVMQANLQPGDIVLVSSDCHKSIPYSILLCGATPIFLETYPLNEYDLYGCVTLKRIKQVLLDLKKQGCLQRVRQITLTNSTFDGVIYDVKRYMMDILAIKPDIIFHWDEAWFSFAYFNPLYQGKTAMSAANALSMMQDDPQYHALYSHWKERTLPEGEEPDDDYLLNNDLYPDPEKYQVRVYATHSVHKTLTAFRQASMLHVHDVAFSEDDFYEAYRTHTSTSPNYQIIASLDFARRQMSLEGYELVKKSIRLAWQLRREISHSSHLNRYFGVLDDSHLVPEEYCRQLSPDTPSQMFYTDIFRCHRNRLFAVDPTRITIDVSNTGLDGPNFRQMLMTQYDIQVNKTSHNTILFIINIGVDDKHIRYLLQSLHHIASKLDHSPAITGHEKYIASLPLTRSYHQRFSAVQASEALAEEGQSYQAVELRPAYYAGMKAENIEFVPLSAALLEEVASGRELVSAGFITPYPPGFPIVVPGQLITRDILRYLQNIQIKEIHGYHADKGLKLFTREFLREDR